MLDQPNVHDYLDDGVSGTALWTERGVTPDEARILAVVGHELFMASQGTLLAQRMRKPQPGDLVLEISDFGRGWDPNRIGRLVRVEGKYPSEQYVVAPLHAPDRQAAWRNGDFIALPTQRSSEWLNGDKILIRTKYQPLTDYLLQDGRERIEMGFDEIEALMGDHRLPPSARNPRLSQWWDNDFDNVQAKAWMVAGYLVEAVDISGQRVRFRSHGRDDQ
jgi:hypothetical protein